MARMGIREYARYRKCGHASVLRAIESGRLKRSVAYEGGKPFITDHELADEEWRRNTDLTKAPAYVIARADGPQATAGPQSISVRDAAECCKCAYFYAEDGPWNMAGDDWRHHRSRLLFVREQVRQRVTDAAALQILEELIDDELRLHVERLGGYTFGDDEP